MSLVEETDTPAEGMVEAEFPTTSPEISTDLDTSSSTIPEASSSDSNLNDILQNDIPPTSRSNAASSSNSVPEADSQFFECNICFDAVNQPVVTFCGHLFCWPCMYRWLEQSPTCPVCKAGASKDKLIPIFGRTSDGHVDRDPRETIPERPQAQRPEPPPAHRPAFPGMFQQHFGQTNITFSAGVFPFGFQMNWPNQELPLTEQQQHQAFMSRILLTLGCIVLLILILL